MRYDPRRSWLSHVYVVAFCATISVVGASGACAANWTELTGAAPWSNRSDTTMTAWRGALWLTGGEIYTDAYTNPRDVWRSGDGGASWACATPAAPWSGRGYHAAAVADGGRRLLITGGGHCSNHFNASKGDDCTAYDWHGEGWSTADGADWELVYNFSSHGTTSAGWGPRGGHGLLTLVRAGSEELVLVRVQ
jgi:hypothetical protein